MTLVGALFMLVGAAAATGLTLLTHKPHPSDVRMFERVATPAALDSRSEASPAASASLLA